MSVNIHPFPQNQPPPRTGQAFLRRIHGPGWVDIWVACSGGKKDWRGGRAGPDLLTNFPVSVGHYYSSAHIRPGAKTRSNVTFESLWAVVLDDIGTGVGSKLDLDLDGRRMFLPEPTAIIETSDQNSQWVYALSVPEADTGKIRAAFAALKAHPLLGPAFKDTADLTHYFRLPGGVNPKEDRDNSFSTVCREFDLANVYEFDDLLQRFGLDQAAISAAAAPLRGAVSSVPSAQIPASRLREIMRLIPNNLDRIPWTGVAHAIMASTEDEPDEGREIWVEWSEARVDAQGKPDKVKPGEAERVWDTLPYDHKAGAETIRRYLEPVAASYKDRILGDDDGFVTEIDEARVAAATATPEEKATDLFLRLRQSRALPQGYDGPSPGAMSGWTQTGPATRFPLRPQVIGGLLRGSASMVSGIPGGGKSAFSLLAAQAVAHENPTIAGFPNLKFPGAVVVVSNEDPQEEVERRLEAINIRHGLGAPLHPVIVTAGSLLRRSDEGKSSFVLTKDGVRFLENLTDLRASHDVALIVIDTLITIATGADENSANDTQAIMRFLQRLAWAAWASVLVLHHPPKSSWSDDNSKRTLSAIRGSGAIAGSLRSAYTLSTPTLDEQRAYGWTAGQAKDLAVLETSKGSWLRAGSKVFYEKAAAGLPSFDPFNPTAPVPDEETLVLVPITPSAPSTGSVIQKTVEKLLAHPNPVRWDRSATRASRHPDYFENVVGLDRRRAEQIFGLLEKEGRITTGSRKIGSNMIEIVSVVDGDFEEVGEEVGE